jgi:hypothetical protein
VWQLKFSQARQRAVSGSGAEGAVPAERLQAVAGLSVDAVSSLAVSRSTLKRWRRQVQQTLSA